MRRRSFSRKMRMSTPLKGTQTGALADASNVIVLRGSEMDEGIETTDLVAYFVNQGDKGCYGLILERVPQRHRNSLAPISVPWPTASP